MKDFTTDAEKRATRGYAIVAFLILVLAFAALTITITVDVVTDTEVPFSVYTTIVFGSILAVMVVGMLAARKPRSRATNITDQHPKTRVLPAYGEYADSEDTK